MIVKHCFEIIYLIPCIIAAFDATMNRIIIPEMVVSSIIAFKYFSPSEENYSNVYFKYTRTACEYFECVSCFYIIVWCKKGLAIVINYKKLLKLMCRSDEVIHNY